MLLRGPLRVPSRILADESPRDEAEDDEPGGVNVDGDSGDGENAESGSSGHHGVGEARGLTF